ncbi:MAG: hypothetical protein ICV60_13795 [Pyrinomonadaceae bacterium]|nr:hypothetical protein [Pyrinomonadaceae bacterium]
MTAKLKVILCALILFTSGTAFGQKAAPQIKLRGRGRSLILTSGKVRRTLDVKEQVSAARLDEVKLLFTTRRGYDVYLLVDACGPSKAVPDARRCGAADECSLLWMKLDAAWKIIDVKPARYESCWQSSSASDGYKINGQELRMEYDYFGERKHYKLFYDAEQPERGFQIEESVLEDRGKTN